MPHYHMKIVGLMSCFFFPTVHLIFAQLNVYSWKILVPSRIIRLHIFRSQATVSQDILYGGLQQTLYNSPWAALFMLMSRALENRYSTFVWLFCYCQVEWYDLTSEDYADERALRYRWNWLFRGPQNLPCGWSNNWSKAVWENLSRAFTHRSTARISTNKYCRLSTFCHL